MKRHLHAEALGIEPRPAGWKSIANRANNSSLDPNWTRADLVDNIGGAFSEISHQIGMRQCRSHVHPQMVSDLPDSWTPASLRRMEFNQWGLAPRPDPKRKEGPTSRIFRSGMARHIDRNRR